MGVRSGATGRGGSILRVQPLQNRLSLSCSVKVGRDGATWQPHWRNRRQLKFSQTGVRQSVVQAGHRIAHEKGCEH